MLRASDGVLDWALRRATTSAIFAAISLRFLLCDAFSFDFVVPFEVLQSAQFDVRTASDAMSTDEPARASRDPD